MYLINNFKNYKMLKKFTLSDKLLFIFALFSLILSEILYFQGNKNQAIFKGMLFFLQLFIFNTQLLTAIAQSLRQYLPQHDAVAYGTIFTFWFS
jgi:hypothetical protein